MTEQDLKSLIGCVLVYKIHEIIIISNVINNNITLLLDNTTLQLNVLDFIEQYIPKLKIYLTEDESSLVTIDSYLQYYY